VVAVRFKGSRFTLKYASVVDVCAIYWFYVCGLWAVLFPLLYLY
jgi:heme/copper-type cytochrome/quinol oxidase subunit 3